MIAIGLLLFLQIVLLSYSSSGLTGENFLIVAKQRSFYYLANLPATMRVTQPFYCTNETTTTTERRVTPNQVRVCHGTEDKTLENQSPMDAFSAEEPTAWLSRGFVGRLVKVGRSFPEHTQVSCLIPFRFVPRNYTSKRNVLDGRASA